MTLALLVAAAVGAAHAGAEAGGYLRVMTRPDFQGGDGRLGYWNLYGRLLNEGPYAALDLRFDLLERESGGTEPWSDAHVRVEGGSIGGMDAGDGGLENLRLSQVYVEAGNVALRDVTWRAGTLDSWFGDLGLYDMRPTSIFGETVGMSARWDVPFCDVLIGGGDSGYGIRGAQYSTIFTGGGSARFRLGTHLELGGGGEVRHEPQVTGNRFAPHATPDVAYEDWLRGEVVESWFESDPLAPAFPGPVPTQSTSWAAVGYLGFGKLGPLIWNNLFLRRERLHPENFTTEDYDGEGYEVYVEGLTDDRYVWIVGNEARMTVWPERMEAALAGLWGDHTDLDNTMAPSDHARTYASAVLRLQAFPTATVHVLVESSVARETSRNGNAYREHADSIFAGTGGVPDTRGFENGDSAVRDTWQGKGGIVLNPMGPGIYARPSLRVLYGLQLSSQNNAFGNSFVETVDQYNTFGNVERHWHHVVALEAEAWF